MGLKTIDAWEQAKVGLVCLYGSWEPKAREVVGTNEVTPWVRTDEVYGRLGGEKKGNRGD